MSAATTSLATERRRARTAPAAADFLRGGGWHAVTTRSGDRGGMTAHRGVLHPDEWVDRARLVAGVEARLGFGLVELRTAYRQGRKSAAQRELRSCIDARLLDVACAGGNMTLLAHVTGLTDRVVFRALKRARAAKALSSAGPT